MIYFIKNLSSERIKIGFSKTPKKRLKDLQTGSDSKLILLKTIEGNMETEKKLHEMFSHLRAEGEWFEPDSELLEYIKGYNIKTLEGKYFHSFNEDRKIEWQGYIISEPREGYFLVQLFDWILGEASTQQLVYIQDMLLWNFYDSAEDMNYYYEYKYSGH